MYELRSIDKSLAKNYIYVTYIYHEHLLLKEYSTIEHVLGLDPQRRSWPVELDTWITGCSFWGCPCPWRDRGRRLQRRRSFMGFRNRTRLDDDARCARFSAFGARLSNWGWTWTWVSVGALVKARRSPASQFCSDRATAQYVVHT